MLNIWSTHQSEAEYMQFSFKNKKFDVTFSQTFSGFDLQMYAVQILYPGMKL